MPGEQRTGPSWQQATKVNEIQRKVTRRLKLKCTLKVRIQTTFES